jgi:hypothetical protein
LTADFPVPMSDSRSVANWLLCSRGCVLSRIFWDFWLETFLRLRSRRQSRLNLRPPLSPSVAATPVQASEVAGERRHLTILFCDLVGLIMITARFDPEEWRATVVPTKKSSSEPEIWPPRELLEN